jgi:hypothetical protein
VGGRGRSALGSGDGSRSTPLTRHDPHPDVDGGDRRLIRRQSEAYMSCLLFIRMPPPVDISDVDPDHPDIAPLQDGIGAECAVYERSRSDVGPGCYARRRDGAPPSAAIGPVPRARVAGAPPSCPVNHARSQRRCAGCWT